jgi:murein DD-endopeptidase MepM/ murein hydrolase activator NlpD
MRQVRKFLLFAIVMELISVTVVIVFWPQLTERPAEGEGTEIRIGTIQNYPAVLQAVPDNITEFRPTDTPTPTETPTVTPTFTPTETPTLTPTPTPDPRIGAVSDQGLIWPYIGGVAAEYGPAHPLGIDIDGYDYGCHCEGKGEPVAAATSGQVVFAGGNPCCSYGNYVVLVSPEGIETLYAHLDSISVQPGQSVQRGEEVGKLGDSGYSTGPHLHFEVIDNGVRVNPLDYLP